jgi:hypothetical protein
MVDFQWFSKINENLALALKLMILHVTKLEKIKQKNGFFIFLKVRAADNLGALVSRSKEVSANRQQR